jgi:hypothetical protein
MEVGIATQVGRSVKNVLINFEVRLVRMAKVSNNISVNVFR